MGKKHGKTHRKYRKQHCEQCGETRSAGKMEYLEVHHIDHNPKNNRPSNLQTLCVQCHDQHHASINALVWEAIAMSVAARRMTVQQCEGIGMPRSKLQRLAGMERRDGKPSKRDTGMHWLLKMEKRCLEGR